MQAIWQGLQAGGWPLVFFAALWSNYKKVWHTNSNCPADLHKQRADKAEADRDRQTKLLQDRYIPAIVEFTHVAKDLLNGPPQSRPNDKA